MRKKATAIFLTAAIALSAVSAKTADGTAAQSMAAVRIEGMSFRVSDEWKENGFFMDVSSFSGQRNVSAAFDYIPRGRGFCNAEKTKPVLLDKTAKK